MDKKNLVGVVTVTYNSSKVLPAFLECMAAQIHGDYLLYAVDNASKDETVKMLQECHHPRMIIIANPDNRGVAEGNNQGIRAALADGCNSVLLLNNDTEFDEHLLSRLAEKLESDSVEMVCPKIMYYDEPNKIWAAGGNFEPLYGYRGVHCGEGESDGGQYDRERIVTYAPTCCVLIGRSVFERIGIMDARYFVYVDDTDFMYRAWKAGCKLLYLPDVKMFHKVSSLTGQVQSIVMIKFCTRNRVYFLLKHLGLLRSVPILLLYQLHFLTGLLAGKLTKRVYTEKVKSVAEGIKMWRTALASKNA